MNGKPDTDDFTGRFRIVCDYDREVLYVAVEVTDDQINLENSVDMWNSRDICEVFLSLKHSREQAVPLQFVYRKKPIVAEGDEPNKDLQHAFAVVRKQEGNKLTYEWRFDLASLPGEKGSIQQPAIFGFDVGYVDLDEDGVTLPFSALHPERRSI